MMVNSPGRRFGAQRDSTPRLDAELCAGRWDGETLVGFAEWVIEVTEWARWRAAKRPGDGEGPDVESRSPRSKNDGINAQRRPNDGRDHDDRDDSGGT